MLSVASFIKSRAGRKSNEAPLGGFLEKKLRIGPLSEREKQFGDPCPPERMMYDGRPRNLEIDVDET